MNPLLFPPTLIKRALEDLAALADAARSLPRMEADLAATREGVEGLQAELEPMLELPRVRGAVEPLPGLISELRDHLRALREEMAPIAELPRVREGIEPLDEDMRSVRESVEHLEPIIKQVNARLATLDKRIETLRADLAPLGDLADKLPGVGR